MAVKVLRMFPVCRNIISPHSVSRPKIDGKFLFLESLSRSLGEQVMNDDRTRQALKEYIVSLMQRKFDEYIDQKGRDALIQQEEVPQQLQ